MGEQGHTFFNSIIWHLFASKVKGASAECGETLFGGWLSNKSNIYSQTGNAVGGGKVTRTSRTGVHILSNTSVAS